MSSAVEAKLEVLFINAKQTMPMQQTLLEVEPLVPDASPDRQLHGVWHGNKQNHPKSHKYNGHAVSLTPCLQKNSNNFDTTCDQE